MANDIITTNPLLDPYVLDKFNESLGRYVSSDLSTATNGLIKIMSPTDLRNEELFTAGDVDYSQITNDSQAIPISKITTFRDKIDKQVWSSGIVTNTITRLRGVQPNYDLGIAEALRQKSDVMIKSVWEFTYNCLDKYYDNAKSKNMKLTYNHVSPKNLNRIVNDASKILARGSYRAFGTLQFVIIMNRTTFDALSEQMQAVANPFFNSFEFNRIAPINDSEVSAGSTRGATLVKYAVQSTMGGNAAILVLQDDVSVVEGTSSYNGFESNKSTKATFKNRSGGVAGKSGTIYIMAAPDFAQQAGGSPFTIGTGLLQSGTRESPYNIAESKHLNTWATLCCIKQGQVIPVDLQTIDDGSGFTPVNN